MANLSNINNKFLVTTGGNVLIGQTAAVGSSILQITGASSPLAIHTPSGNNGLEFIIDNGLYKNWQIGVQNQVGNALTIVPSTAAGNTTFSTPVATFLTSGNVGIGTSSPNYKLQVEGTASKIFNVTNTSTYSRMLLTGASGTGGDLIFSEASTGTAQFGIYSNGAQATSTLGIYPNDGSSPAILVKQNGNVGIGTSSPYDVGLQVSHSLGNGGIMLGNTATTGSKEMLLNIHPLGLIWQRWVNGAYQANLMTLDYNGNLGIGTTSPRGMLEISKGDNTDVDGPELFLTRKDINTVPGNLVGSLTFYNEDADGAHRSSWVRGYAAETYGRQGYLSFGTAGVNSTDATEKMRITGGGNVAIGGTLGADSQFRVELKPSGTILAGLRIGYSGASSNYFDGNDQFFRDGAGTTNRMHINSSGTVTIGGGGNNTSSSNNFIPVKINTPYSTTASPQWSLQGWVATTDGADPFAMTSGETTKNVYMGMIGAQYMNQNRFSIVQGGQERLTVNLTQTGGGGSPGFVGIGTGLPSSKLHVVGGATNSQHIIRGPYTVGISGTGVGSQPLSFAYNFNGLFNTGYAVEVYALFNHWSSGTANYTYCYRKGVFMGYGAAGGTEILGPGGGVSDSVNVGAWTFSVDNNGSTGYAQRILINKSAGNAAWNGTYWVQIVCSVPLDPTDVS